MVHLYLPKADLSMKNTWNRFFMVFLVKHSWLHQSLCLPSNMDCVRVIIGIYICIYPEYIMPIIECTWWTNWCMTWLGKRIVFSNSMQTNILNILYFYYCYIILLRLYFLQDCSDIMSFLRCTTLMRLKG